VICIEGVVICIEGAVICIEGAVRCEKEPPLVEGPVDSLRVPLPLFEASSEP
jgi:hypothetical protein